MATKNGTNALEAAYSWVYNMCDWDECETVDRAIAHLTQERGSLDSWEFEEFCRYNLALLELGVKVENIAINEVFNLYKASEITRNEVITIINTDADTVKALLSHDDMKELLTLSPEFLTEFFELDDDEQDLVIAWLDYHDYKNYGNDPSDILEKYHGTYSIAEYVQEYLEETGIELPDCIHIDYNQTFNDLTHDCTIVKLGSKYMIYND